MTRQRALSQNESLLDGGILLTLWKRLRIHRKTPDQIVAVVISSFFILLSKVSSISHAAADTSITNGIIGVPTKNNS